MNPLSTLHPARIARLSALAAALLASACGGSDTNTAELPAPAPAPIPGNATTPAPAPQPGSPPVAPSPTSPSAPAPAPFPTPAPSPSPSPTPAPSPAPAPTSPAWTVVSVNTTLAPLPIASDLTPNPGRGYHRWRANPAAVPLGDSAPPLAAFQRYRWNELEGSTPGQYTLSSLVAARDAARAAGQQFAFRLQAMRGYGTETLDVPTYLYGAGTARPECTAPNPACVWSAPMPTTVPPTPPTLVPNWNHPYVLARMQALLQAVAAALGDTSDLAWIDVGLYGQYGEWAQSSTNVVYTPAVQAQGIEAATNATKRSIAHMHFDVFPHAQHAMFIPYSNLDALQYGLFQQTTTTLPVGLRWDCLAQAGYMNQWTNRPADWALIADRWKTAPWVAEFCPFGPGGAQTNAATALQQVRDFHVSTVGNGNLNAPWASFSASEQADLAAVGREAGYRFALGPVSVTALSATTVQLQLRVDNTGNAPLYAPWQLQAQLRNATGQVVDQQVLLSAAQARGVLPGQPAQISTPWTPPSLPAGDYTVHLAWVRQPALAALPQTLRWNMAGIEADGSARLVTLRR